MEHLGCYRDHHWLSPEQHHFLPDPKGVAVGTAELVSTEFQRKVSAICHCLKVGT